MVRFLKKICSIFSFLFILLMVFGCKFTDPYDISNEDYEIRIIDEENKKITVGNIKYQPATGEVFIPYVIDGYTVSSLGISETFSMDADFRNNYISRIYLPSTIEKIRHQYFYLAWHINTDVFFCNKPIDLYMIYNDHQDRNDRIKIYVPFEYYDGYKEINKWRTIYKANVCYYLNLEEDNDYYYIDYYEENSLIEFIPPNPVKDGYVFEGWYKEKECINKWNFESDIFKLDENSIELKLYAKWRVK